MEGISIFLWAVGQGFLVTAPVGPIGILCIQKTLACGRSAGFAVGLGGALAAVLYAGIVGFGFGGVTAALQSVHFWIGILGGLFLMLFGWSIARTHPHAQNGTIAKKRCTRELYSLTIETFFLTLVNPLMIILFMSMFAESAYVPSVIGGLLVTLGVFGGSMLWWTVLVTLVLAMRRIISPKLLHMINVVAGVGILCFGLYTLLAALSTCF
ncbi:MAG: LysE family transporter [Candidatus Babeliaceae bacterium]|nr:LysE family transporter [Candidatus Babeliaceae bacterium]